jgi:hypothetical protein
MPRKPFRRRGGEVTSDAGQVKECVRAIWPRSGSVSGPASAPARRWSLVTGHDVGLSVCYRSDISVSAAHAGTPPLLPAVLGSKDFEAAL